MKAGFNLTACDRGHPRVRFETSRSLLAILQFMFAQDKVSGPAMGEGRGGGGVSGSPGMPICFKNAKRW